MSVVPVGVPDYSGCLWPVDPACQTAEWDALDGDVQIRALSLASSTLRRLTGYRVGGCPITVRPVQAKGACWIPMRASVPVPGVMLPGQNIHGEWVNTVDPGYTTDCEIALPAPVGMVEVVRVDGVEIPYADYQIDDGNLLVWMGDGDCPWPQTQDLSLPDTEPDTFSVTYWNSYPVDSVGAYAAGILALEFAKACTGTKCRLPANVISLSRSGVTYEIQGGSFPGGFTGIREVDTYIATWNPRGLVQDAAIWTPGQHRPRRNTGGAPIAPGRIYDGGHP